MDKRIIILIAAASALCIILMIAVVLVSNQPARQTVDQVPTIPPPPTESEIIPTAVPTRISRPSISPANERSTLDLASVGVLDETTAVTRIETPSAANPELVSTIEAAIRIQHPVIAENEVSSLTIVPPTDHGVVTVNDQLLVRFQEPLLPGVVYSYAIKDSGTEPATVVGGSFQTEGPTPTPGVMVNDPADFVRAEQRIQEDTPDVTVANETPYETETFSISARYQPPPNERFTFVVRTVQPEQAQQDLRRWLSEEIGLTTAQINQLEVVYTRE